MTVFINIDPPSATSFIEAFGINASGQIVGFYDNLQRHGFLYSGGTYTTLDVPMAASTEADGINDFGHVVGTYQDSGLKFHG
jgi:probable HAF family extracellular repeat protein